MPKTLSIPSEQKKNFRVGESFLIFSAEFYCLLSWCNYFADIYTHCLAILLYIYQSSACLLEEIAGQTELTWLYITRAFWDLAQCKLKPLCGQEKLPSWPPGEWRPWRLATKENWRKRFIKRRRVAGSRCRSLRQSLWNESQYRQQEGTYESGHAAS